MPSSMYRVRHRLGPGPGCIPALQLSRQAGRHHKTPVVDSKEVSSGKGTRACFLLQYTMKKNTSLRMVETGECRPLCMSARPVHSADLA